MKKKKGKQKKNQVGKIENNKMVDFNPVISTSTLNPNFISRVIQRQNVVLY